MKTRVPGLSVIKRASTDDLFAASKEFILQPMCDEKAGRTVYQNGVYKVFN